jgi:hypothetical protein
MVNGGGGREIPHLNHAFIFRGVKPFYRGQYNRGRRRVTKAEGYRHEFQPVVSAESALGTRVDQRAASSLHRESRSGKHGASPWNTTALRCFHRFQQQRMTKVNAVPVPKAAGI